MRSTCPHRLSDRCIRNGFPKTMIFALVGWIAGVTPAMAAERRPVLVVPASEATLHVAVELPEAVNLAPGREWQLVEVGRPEATIPVQRVPAIAADGSAGAERGRLVAAIPPCDDAKRRRRFRLRPAKEASGDAPGGFRFTEIDEKSLKLADGEAPVLVYNHGVITKEDVPQSDHRRRRASYVHPLWGLSGEVLTDDFPKDHYHHHGVFWTWPHVVVDGKEHSLWDGNTIRDTFVRWICRQSGPVAAVLAVENGWFVGDEKVMIERVWMRVFQVSDDSRALDLEFTWIPAENPVTLQGAAGKSYGGLTVRFAPRSEEDALITVPSGRTTEDMPEAPLAWADFTSRLGGASSPSGAAMFVHPRHPDYPPTWLTRHYGAMCIGWPGVKARTFEPGKPIRLDYRIWIHKSAVEPDELKRAYGAYLTATHAQWK